MAETVRKQYSKETLKILDGLCLLDDDFMTMVFDENKEATDLLLNIILRRDDMKAIKVERQEIQKEMKNPLVGGRDVRLDIYAKDSEGRTYDIEVQQSDFGADVHRARFNSAMLDVRMLKAGQDFSEINESYVIFITKHDIIGAGLPMYHADRVFKETGEDFGDGNHIVYVNGSYDGDSSIGRLMHDFRSYNAAEMYYPELANQVRYYKESKEGREVMCKAIEEYADKRSEESRIETLFNIMKGLMESMKWTAEQAMNAMQISDSDKAILTKRF